MPMALSQTAFGAGEISPSLYGRDDLAKWGVGLGLLRNAYALKQGSIMKRAGLRFICEVADSASPVRILPFSFNTEQTYVLELGHQTMRVLRDGGQVLDGAPATITAISVSLAATITTSGAHGLSDGDEVFISGVTGAPTLAERVAIVRSPTSTTFRLEDAYGEAISTIGATIDVTGATADRVFKIATPWDSADVGTLDFIQSADTMFVVHPLYAPRKITRTGHAAWTISAVAFTPAITAPANVAAAASTGTGSTDYSYVVTAIASETQEESLPSTADTVANDLTSGSNANTITWDAVTGADRYRVYKQDQGVFRYIGFTTDLSFIDDNIGTDENDTPPQATTLFNGAGNYPSAVGFYEQRLVFAGSINAPQTVWMSRSESIENFTGSVLTQPNDVIIANLFGRQVNRVRFIEDLNELVILTAGAERTLRGNDGYITPSNGIRSNVSTRGCAEVKPLVIGASLLMVGSDSKTVYEKTFSGFDSQGRSVYEERELTVLAEHLVRDRAIVRMSHALSPDSLVVMATDDETALLFSYHREHDLWAFGRLVPGGDGVIEDVCTIREGFYDRTYCVVRRTINGFTKRYIERLSDRYIADRAAAYFVDSGLSYSGAATSSISGLWHLEGEEVVALADGAVTPPLTVTDGAVSFSPAASVVHVGLPFTAEIETLPLQVPTRSGPSDMRPKKVPRMALRVRDTAGVMVGQVGRDLVPLVERFTATPPPLESGNFRIEIDADWSSDFALRISSPDPLPMEIGKLTMEPSLGN